MAVAADAHMPVALPSFADAEIALSPQSSAVYQLQFKSICSVAAPCHGAAGVVGRGARGRPMYHCPLPPLSEALGLPDVFPHLPVSCRCRADADAAASVAASSPCGLRFSVSELQFCAACL